MENIKYSFLEKNIYIEYIFSSIDIIDTEKYLKAVHKNKKNDLEIIMIPNDYLYNIDHLLFSVFISKNKIIDKINVSDNLWLETLLTLNLTDQIHKIQKEWNLKPGKNNYFVVFVSNKKISKSRINKIIKDLEIKFIKKNRFNKENAKEFYKIKENKDVDKKIIEEMTTYYLKN